MVSTSHFKACLFAFMGVVTLAARSGAEVLAFGMPWEQPLLHGTQLSIESPKLEPGATYCVNVGLMTAALADGEQISVTLKLPGAEPMTKQLHSGDPSYYIPFRITDRSESGPAALEITRNDSGPTRPIEANVQWAYLGGTSDAIHFEAEPNDSPQHANELHLGEDVHGSTDDVEYLDNIDEGKNGLDWFKIEITDEKPCLVIFELDIPDRDVSVNMRAYTLDETGKPVPYLNGKDPMEIVHDRERERYSKVITRNFTKGTYYLEVNANHPRYILRTFKYPVPPYDDPALAIEVGSRYTMDVGDAWLAQIPREGNIFRRAQNMHETAMRCTACHPTVFSTEPVLNAHRNGYPIAAKSNFRYVVERIYNSMTPFYGPDGLYWQRFIAIPLQSQAKQGTILTEFERQVSGKETDLVLRFGPLIRSAWAERTVIIDDELNGVVPRDSKFGIAWRDWKMLKECYRRSGDKSYNDAAMNIEKIFADPESEKKIEALQDKIHLYLGLYYMSPNAYRERIAKLHEELMSLQNEDGSWHEEGKVGSPGAVYATGQILWTLMETGNRPEQDPRIDKGLRWLMSKQLIFGGWFQTDSHENFRTPMRECRYALDALSSGYPKGKPLKGMGNLDGGPAVVPKLDAPVYEVLRALENVWEVPRDQVGDFARSIAPFLNRPEPPVRAAAANLLGRIGGAESVAPLLPLFRDPSKLVWRDAAWAVRQLGNQGFATNVLLASLKDSDPIVRRSATRAFAYQFEGMDGRMDIAHTFVRLASDPDLLTRLQALRTLRQWFYRSDDPAFKLTVVQTVIDRMGVPENKLMRTNLAQNMYILLDENQSGGVSMQRNLRDVPDRVRENVLNGRIDVENKVLLTPVLRAVASGNDLQREALLESFDGSFFKGRYYARVPRDMIDVGNDREFSFMYVPNEEFLDSTLGKLIATENRPAQLRRGLQLASFFEIPKNTASTNLQLVLLNAMFSDDANLHATAREVVRKDLVVRASENSEIVDRIGSILQGQDFEAQGAVLAALTRSPEVLVLAPVRTTLAAYTNANMDDETASLALLPLVNTDILDDKQALAVLEKSWKALLGKSAAERIPAVEALTKRGTLIGNTEAGVKNAAPEQLELLMRSLRLLENASTDPDTAVREKFFSILPELEYLRKQSRVATVLYAGLSDESPAIRIKALKLAQENDEVWNEEDVHEYVLKNLISADPKVRKASLETVINRKLVASLPRYATRVKCIVDGDADLRADAEKALQEAGQDPATVVADASIAAVRTPDLLYFRDHVNDYFYKKSADQNSCADCHATHTILGLAEPKKDGTPLTDSEVVANFRSMLKVVNTVDPEQSLVLRKPRSPFGTGQASEESPTGVTHVGGVRWADGTSDSAYQAVLAFVRTAGEQANSKPTNALADSYSPEYPATLATDGSTSTIWHTEFVGAMPGYPHELVLDLGETKDVRGFTYIPRQDSDTGRVADFEIYVSMDNQNWGEPVAKGKWANDASAKTVFLDAKQARFVRLRGLSEVKGQPFMSAAEFEALVAKPTQVAAAGSAK